MSEQKYFKNWAIPGPSLTGQHLNPKSNESLDSISGHFKIFQFKDGHRFSTDDLLVALFASMRAPQTRTILELGSGIGTISQILAWKFPLAKITAVEAQEQSFNLAKKSIKLNQIENQITLVNSDFRNFSTQDTFDIIVGSPPYFAEDSGHRSLQNQKEACRFETRGTIIDYCKIASKYLGFAGIFVFIFPIEPDFQRKKIKTGMESSGLKIIEEIPVIFKEGEKPILSVFISTMKQFVPEHIQTHTQNPIIIRLKNGTVSPEYQRLKMSIGFPP